MAPWIPTTFQLATLSLQDMLKRRSGAACDFPVSGMVPSPSLILARKTPLASRLGCASLSAISVICLMNPPASPHGGQETYRWKPIPFFKWYLPPLMASFFSKIDFSEDALARLSCWMRYRLRHLLATTSAWQSWRISPCMRSTVWGHFVPVAKLTTSALSKVPPLVMTTPARTLNLRYLVIPVPGLKMSSWYLFTIKVWIWSASTYSWPTHDV